jgi:hypothetical protein
MQAKQKIRVNVKNSISVAHSVRGPAGSGTHKNRTLSIKRGSSRKIKHKNKDK